MLRTYQRVVSHLMMCSCAQILPEHRGVHTAETSIQRVHPRPVSTAMPHLRAEGGLHVLRRQRQPSGQAGHPALQRYEHTPLIRSGSASISVTSHADDLLVSSPNQVGPGWTFNVVVYLIFLHSPPPRPLLHFVSVLQDYAKTDLADVQ